MFCSNSRGSNRVLGINRVEYSTVKKGYIKGRGRETLISNVNNSRGSNSCNSSPPSQPVVGGLYPPKNNRCINEVSQKSVMCILCCVINKNIRVYYPPKIEGFLCCIIIINKGISIFL